MRHCPELAAELKLRKASCREKATVNFVDDFKSDDDSSEEDFLEPEGELPAVNLTELNLVDSNMRIQGEEWYVDSGASKHFTGTRHLLSSIESVGQSNISTARGEKLSVAG